MNKPARPSSALNKSLTIEMGPVALAVADLARSLSFYKEVLGCSLLLSQENVAVLGSERPLLLLIEQKTAPPRPAHTTGLYHVAFLLPGRVDLACALRHLLACGYPIKNMEDHGISEAIYLSDPDGNGIELYRDRPRSAWSWQNGELKATGPSTQLNMASLLAELDGTEYIWHGLPPFARIGHVHLQVSDLAQSAAFYGQVLGLEESITGISGANFFAAGGYHHHIACNVWAGLDAIAPPSSALGLRFFTLVLSESDQVKELLVRLPAGSEITQNGQAHLLRDPSRNGVLLTTDSLQNSQEVMELTSVFGL